MRPFAVHLSLSAKIVTQVLIAVLLTFIIIALGISQVHNESRDHEWSRNVANMASYLSQAIIDNPQPAFIADLATRLQIQIRYSSPASSYATNSELPTWRATQQKGRRSYRHSRNLPPNFKILRYKGYTYLAHSLGSHRFVYRLATRHLGNWTEIATVTLTLLVILGALYGLLIFIIYRQLRPLARMATEMETFGTDSLTNVVPAPSKSKDEIMRLADSFTKMRARVGSLLESKETLLRDVSHEIRSPLARMRLNLEFINDPKIRTRLTADIETLDSLASELLERAALDTGSTPLDLVPVDLGALAATAIDVADVTKRYCQLQKSTVPVMVMGNQRLLLRCLNNILDNSLKYSRLSTNSIQLTVTTVALAGQDWGQLIISDRGTQIETAVCDRLFEPFYRPESSRARHMGGTGLGLTIVASIVQAHGGRITVVSPTAGGLQITIILPSAVKA